MKKAGTPKPKLGYKRPGFTLGGPVVIPGLYDGHDKTFFFAAVEWLYDKFPEPLSQTVPTAGDAQRRFLGAARPGHHHLRSAERRRSRPAPASSGSRSPATSSRRTGINPIAQKVLSYYPLPNQPADVAAAGTTSSTRIRAPTTSIPISTRFDHTVTVEAAR